MRTIFQPWSPPPVIVPVTYVQNRPIRCKATPETLHAHLQMGKGVRPLLLNKTPEEVETFIKEQLKQREPFYLKAQHIFDIDVIDDYDKIQNTVKKLRLQLGI